MANEFDQLTAFAATIQQMLVGIEASNVMHKYIRAYDQFASDAMMGLLEKTSVDKLHPNMIAALSETAWQIADAMMVERRKRAIGGVELKSESKEESNFARLPWCAACGETVPSGHRHTCFASPEDMTNSPYKNGPKVS